MFTFFEESPYFLRRGKEGLYKTRRERDLQNIPFSSPSETCFQPLFRSLSHTFSSLFLFSFLLRCGGGGGPFDLLFFRNFFLLFFRENDLNFRRSWFTASKKKEEEKEERKMCHPFKMSPPSTSPFRVQKRGKRKEKKPNPAGVNFISRFSFSCLVPPAAALALGMIKLQTAP